MKSIKFIHPNPKPRVTETPAIKWVTGEKTYKSLSALVADDPVTYDTNAKEHGLLPIEGSQMFKNLTKRDKHDLSSLPSPKKGDEKFFLFDQSFLESHIKHFMFW